jgi:hypothetical protein
MNISQSLMNQVLEKPCPYAIKLEWLDKKRSEPSDLMKRGHYFEYCVIGDSSSEAPQLDKLKNGGKSQAEKDIDDLVVIAKKTLEGFGLELGNSQTQLRLEVNGKSGLIDLVANDIEDRTRKAIYDIKYTETKYDDRWNGWADIESRPTAKRQARHYIHLWKEIHGEWLPYYFVIFGKSGWCRIIKCIVTAESMAIHAREIEVVSDMLSKWKAEGWKADPSYEKCRDCRVAQFCEYYKVLPDIEQASI